MARLVGLLSPDHPPSMHIIATEILTSIIALCAPSAFNPAGGNASEQSSQQPGQPPEPPKARNNRLLRELVSEANITTLVGFMLDDLELSDAVWQGLAEGDEKHPSDPFIVHPLPSLASASSSISAICAIFVELIRRNNSDFSEPHVFHTLRNRLMWFRQQDAEAGKVMDEDEQREDLERKLAECVESHGIVHLGTLLTAICDRFEKVNVILTSPRTQKRLASALQPAPLTLERFRVIELYAELLHSSNMSILNRPAGTGPTYTPLGVLSGGLSGLEALGEAIDADRIGDGDEGNPEALITQARELPVSNSSAGSMSGSDGTSSDDEDLLEQIEGESTPSPSPSASGILAQPIGLQTPKASQQPIPSPPASNSTQTITDISLPPAPSPEDEQRLRNVMETEAGFKRPSTDPPNGESTLSPSITPRNSIDAASHAAIAANTAAPSIPSEPVSPPVDIADPPVESLLPAGDRLKQVYIQHRVLPTVVELFFEYPNNDFMHHVVYDVLQQILNGRLGPGWNRELIIDLICEAKLIERIIAAQKLNDDRLYVLPFGVYNGKADPFYRKQPRTARLAYMGHIVLISEELVKFFSRCPPRPRSDHST